MDGTLVDGSADDEVEVATMSHVCDGVYASSDEVVEPVDEVVEDVIWE